VLQGDQGGHLRAALLVAQCNQLFCHGLHGSATSSVGLQCHNMVISMRFHTVSKVYHQAGWALDMYSNAPGDDEYRSMPVHVLDISAAEEASQAHDMCCSAGPCAPCEQAAWHHGL
jgi:hypothetical protein